MKGASWVRITAARPTGSLIDALHDAKRMGNGFYFLFLILGGVMLKPPGLLPFLAGEGRVVVSERGAIDDSDGWSWASFLFSWKSRISQESSGNQVNAVDFTCALIAELPIQEFIPC